MLEGINLTNDSAWSSITTVIKTMVWIILVWIIANLMKEMKKYILGILYAHCSG